MRLASDASAYNKLNRGACSVRLQEETTRVEDVLAKPKSLDVLLKCFVSAKAVSFENPLDPFLKICRHSTAIAIGIANAQFFRRIKEKLSNGKAVVKLNSASSAPYAESRISRRALRNTRYRRCFTVVRTEQSSYANSHARLNRVWRQRLNLLYFT